MFSLCRVILVGNSSWQWVIYYLHCRHVKIYDIQDYTVVHSMDYPSPILSLGVSVSTCRNSHTLFPNRWTTHGSFMHRNWPSLPLFWVQFFWTSLINLHTEEENGCPFGVRSIWQVSCQRVFFLRALCGKSFANQVHVTCLKDDCKTRCSKLYSLTLVG